MVRAQAKSFCDTELSVRQGKAISSDNSARTNTCLDIQSFIQQQKDTVKCSNRTVSCFSEIVACQVQIGHWYNAGWWKNLLYVSELGVLAKHFCTRSSEILVVLMLPTMHPNRFRRAAHGIEDAPDIAEKRRKYMSNFCIGKKNIQTNIWTWGVSFW